MVDKAEEIARLMAPPRNPARMPAGVEQAAADMTVNPLWELAQGVGATASGAWNSPETGGGLMAAMGLMTPMARGVAPIARAASEAAPLIRAFHGSPHSFDRFDISKIGSGEGNQVYGHGLYFAGNEGVAKGYRDTLSDKVFKALTPDEHQLINPIAAKYALKRNAVDEQIENLQGNISHLRGRMAKPDKFSSEHDAPTLAMMEQQLAAWQKLKADPSTSGGHMYEVGLHADPEKLLDWDAPIGSQAGPVQDALRPRGIKPEWTGAQAYESTKLVPGDYRDPAAASKSLLDMGVPGIKYLDGQSRDAGAGSHNYVMFDDKLIDILRKYGLAGAAPVGGAAALSQQAPDPNKAEMARIMAGGA